MSMLMPVERCYGPNRSWSSMAKKGWPQPNGSWREKDTYITKKRKNTWDDDADLVIWTRGHRWSLGSGGIMYFFN